jgi:hypothetical protein
LYENVVSTNGKKKFTIAVIPRALPRVLKSIHAVEKAAKELAARVMK